MTQYRPMSIYEDLTKHEKKVLRFVSCIGQMQSFPTGCH